MQNLPSRPVRRVASPSQIAARSMIDSSRVPPVAAPVDEEDINYILSLAEERHKKRSFTRTQAARILEDLALTQCENLPDSFAAWTKSLNKKSYPIAQMRKVMRGFLRDTVYVFAMQGCLRRKVLSVDETRNAQKACKAITAMSRFRRPSHQAHERLSHRGFDEPWSAFHLYCLFDASVRDPQQAPLPTKKCFVKDITWLPLPGQMIALQSGITRQQNIDSFAVVLVAELGLDPVQEHMKELTRPQKGSILSGSIIPKWARGFSVAPEIDEDPQFFTSYCLSALKMRLRTYLIFGTWQNIFPEIRHRQSLLGNEYQLRKDVEFETQLRDAAIEALDYFIVECEIAIAKMDDWVSTGTRRYRPNNPIAEPRLRMRKSGPPKEPLPAPTVRSVKKKTERVVASAEKRLVKVLEILCRLSQARNIRLLSRKNSASLYHSVLKNDTCRSLYDLHSLLRNWAWDSGLDKNAFAADRHQKIEGLISWLDEGQRFPKAKTPRLEHARGFGTYKRSEVSEDREEDEQEHPSTKGDDDEYGHDDAASATTGATTESSEPGAWADWQSSDKDDQEEEESAEEDEENAEEEEG